MIADSGNHVVRSINPLGVVATVAGDGDEGDDGDGGPATEARLGTPDDIAPLMNGGFLIADYTEEVVRQVLPSATSRNRGRSRLELRYRQRR